MGEYSTPSYGDAPYWDARYEKEGPEKTFDWYQQYTALAPIFDIYMDKASKVLMVGCGNAVLSEDMVQNGYQDIWNIDISSVVVDFMKKRNSDIPQLKYDTMNVCSMGFDESAFDVVLDKGTLDAILCGNNSVENASAMLSEVCRVLKPGGKFLLITYGDPQVRLSHLRVDTLKWTVKVHALPRPGASAEVCPPWSLVPMKFRSNGQMVPNGEDLEGGNVHYIYVCTKDA
ncbi:unnamed protein product [Closterium sp. Yama58-4]|nr:unnamed protein product [Closterium sp. Yama58-4]